MNRCVNRGVNGGECRSFSLNEAGHRRTGRLRRLASPPEASSPPARRPPEGSFATAGPRSDVVETVETLDASLSLVESTRM